MPAKGLVRRVRDFLAPSRRTHSAAAQTENATFVGRIAGEDVGYAGTTGAEARGQHARERRSKADDEVGADDYRPKHTRDDFDDR